MFADSFPDIPVIPDDDIDYETSDDDSENDSFKKNISNKKTLERQITETMGFGDSSEKVDKESTTIKTTGKFGLSNSNSSDANEKFTFHNFGYHPTPFRDLLDNLSTLKATYRQKKVKGRDSPERHHHHHHHSHHHTHNHHSTGHHPKPHTKLFDIEKYQKEQIKNNKKRNMTVAQFKPKENLWNGTMTPDPHMLKSLYRIPCQDPSGKLISGVSRDIAKGCVPWKACEADRDIPPPDYENCSLSYQQMLSKHMDTVIARVKAEYEKMPQKTLKESELRAAVGADLANLIRERELIRDAINKQEVHGASNKSS